MRRHGERIVERVRCLGKRRGKWLDVVVNDFGDWLVVMFCNGERIVEVRDEGLDIVSGGYRKRQLVVLARRCDERVLGM